MDILIFAIGLVIFITYMYFLLKMINIAHKQQEKEQGKLNYKKQLKTTISKRKKLSKIEDKEWDS